MTINLSFFQMHDFDISISFSVLYIHIYNSSYYSEGFFIFFACLFYFLVPYCNICYGQLSTATRRHISGDIHLLGMVPCISPIIALLRLGHKDCIFLDSLDSKARYNFKIIKFIISLCKFCIYLCDIYD